MLVATATRVYRIQTTGGKILAEKCVDGRPVKAVCQGRTCDVIALAPWTLLVGCGGQMVEVFSGINEPVESLLILDETRREILVGTEDARLYRVVENGQVRRVKAFDELDVRHKWHTPWGGPPAVRSLAAADGWVYADIHVGSIMSSPDGGRSWQPVGEGIDEDVHQVATCPAAAARVYANTASAVFISEDHGAMWYHRGAGLGNRYGRAIAVADDDPELVLASVSDGPHDADQDVRAGLYRSEDAGRHWEHVTRGLPASSPRNINTHRIAFSSDGLAWAAIDDKLYVGRERASEWEQAWQAEDAIESISCRPAAG